MAHSRHRGAYEKARRVRWRGSPYREPRTTTDAAAGRRPWCFVLSFRTWRRMRHFRITRRSRRRAESLAPWPKPLWPSLPARRRADRGGRAQRPGGIHGLHPDRPRSPQSRPRRRKAGLRRGPVGAPDPSASPQSRWGGRRWRQAGSYRSLCGPAAPRDGHSRRSDGDRVHHRPPPRSATGQADGPEGGPPGGGAGREGPVTSRPPRSWRPRRLSRRHGNWPPASGPGVRPSSPTRPTRGPSPCTLSRPRPPSAVRSAARRSLRSRWRRPRRSCQGHRRCRNPKDIGPARVWIVTIVTGAAGERQRS